MKLDFRGEGDRCESCNGEGTEFMLQTGVQVYCGGGVGWTTMFKCPACLKASKETVAKSEPIKDVL